MARVPGPGAEEVTVYVDDMNAAYGCMKMSHMLADTDDELHAMAEIGRAHV